VSKNHSMRTRWSLHLSAAGVVGVVDSQASNNVTADNLRFRCEHSAVIPQHGIRSPLETRSPRQNALHSLPGLIQPHIRQDWREIPSGAPARTVHDELLSSNHLALFHHPPVP